MSPAPAPVAKEAAAAKEEEPVPADEVEEDAPGEERRVGPPRPQLVVVVLASVMVLSVSAVFVGLFAFVLSGLQEQRSQHELYASFRGLLDPRSTVAPSIGGNIPAGTPVALLDVPAVGLHDVVVVEGTTSGDLLQGPGHLRSSPLPGQPGQSLLLGKNSTAGAPFGAIARLQAGDVITVRTGQGKFRYAVQGQRTGGGRQLPDIPGDSGVLTLGTSSGSGAFGRLAPDHEVYVDATLVGKAVTAPKGRPTQVASAELPGHGDGNAWPFVALWFSVLLAVSALTWWLWSRWGIWQTWLVGAPMILGVLWVFADEVMRLVPNVY